MLFKSIDFEISEFPGSCAVMVLSRVCGMKVTARQAADCLARIKEDNGTVQRLPTWFRDNPRNATRTMYDSAFAQPHQTQFGIVLSELLQEENDMTTLWCATDSFSTTGDTEQGPFSTRKFIEWMDERDLLRSFTQSKEVLSRQMVGFFFTLNNDACRAEISRCVGRYERRYTRLTAGCRMVAYRGSSASYRPDYNEEW